VPPSVNATHHSGGQTTRYSSASTARHNRSPQVPAAASKKRRATGIGGSSVQRFKYARLYSSVTYPLGSGGNQGYLPEPITTFDKPTLREVGMTVRASQERLQPCTVGFLKSLFSDSRALARRSTSCESSSRSCQRVLSSPYSIDRVERRLVLLDAARVGRRVVRILERFFVFLEAAQRLFVTMLFRVAEPFANG
jgi:hypothetical protein